MWDATSRKIPMWQTNDWRNNWLHGSENNGATSPICSLLAKLAYLTQLCTGLSWGSKTSRSIPLNSFVTGSSARFLTSSTSGVDAFCPDLMIDGNRAAREFNICTLINQGFHCKTPVNLMSRIPRIVIVVISLLTGAHESTAQGTRFFRISGPGPTSILALRPDGTLVWINALAGTYTVQVSIAQPAGTNWVNYLQISATNGLNASQIVAFTSPASMAFVPPGVFTMGDTLDGEEDAVPVANVYVSAFFMDVNLVTYAQWQGVYAWAVSHGYEIDHPGAGKAPNHPVQTVTWYDVVKWNNARSQQAGLSPVYYTDVGLTLVYTNGNVDAVYPNWSANGYRLPTEAEWEKAARGGLIGQRFPWGDTISESQANYDGSTSYPYDLGPNGVNANFDTGGYPYTSPVGSFPSNGYGLYDMAGNVIEWCWDWYASTLSGGINPHGPSSGLYRTYRGGFWGNFPIGLRVADRNIVQAGNDSYNWGFRSVRRAGL